MRKITQQSVAAFIAKTPFSSGNMSVHVTNSDCEMALHGNVIAYYVGNNNIVIRDAGWQTVTTKERLNGLLNTLNLAPIYQKDFIWYRNGEWKGSEVLSV